MEYLVKLCVIKFRGNAKNSTDWTFPIETHIVLWESQLGNCTKMYENDRPEITQKNLKL